MLQIPQLTNYGPDMVPQIKKLKRKQIFSYIRMCDLHVCLYTYLHMFKNSHVHLCWGHVMKSIYSCFFLHKFKAKNRIKLTVKEKKKDEQANYRVNVYRTTDSAYCCQVWGEVTISRFNEGTHWGQIKCSNLIVVKQTN